MMLRVLFHAAIVAHIGALGCGDSTDVTGTGGTIFEPGLTCIAFCAKTVGECDAFADVEGFEDVDEASCQQGCEANLRDETAISGFCGDAVEAVFVCASKLDCDSVESWLARQPTDAFPCLPEVTTVGEVCPAI